MYASAVKFLQLHCLQNSRWCSGNPLINLNRDPFHSDFDLEWPSITMELTIILTYAWFDKPTMQWSSLVVSVKDFPIAKCISCYSKIIICYSILAFSVHKICSVTTFCYAKMLDGNWNRSLGLYFLNGNSEMTLSFPFSAVQIGSIKQTWIMYRVYMYISNIAGRCTQILFEY